MVWIYQQTQAKFLASAIIYTQVRDQDFRKGASKLTSKPTLRSFKSFVFFELTGRLFNLQVTEKNAYQV